MKQFFGKKSRSALATVLMVSLALHIVAILIFGTIKFVSEALREETVFEAAPVEVAPQQQPEYTVNIQQRNQVTPPPRPPTIVVNNPSELDIPALDIEVDIESASVVSRSAGSFRGNLSEVREMAVNTANLFGRQVEATKLGVLLDVSFSTHGVMTNVIEEIRKSFPDTSIVFVPGCNMHERKSEVVPIADFEQTAAKYPLRAGRVFTTKPFIDGLLQTKGFKRVWDSVKSQGRGHVVFTEIFNGWDGNAGSDDAIKFLVRNGADTIYWFADFEDKIDPALAKKVASTLKSSRAKLIMHDFKAPLGKNNNLESLQMLAEQTSGELFLKELY